MKDLTLFAMHSFRFKIVGAIISILGIIFMILSDKIEGFRIVENVDNLRHFQFFFLLAVLGLFLIAFSKEKFEDERVKEVRGKAFQAPFSIIIVVIISFSFTNLISSKLEIETSDLSLLAAISLIVYHIYFHLAVYFDPSFVYNDASVLENVKKNKRFFLIYLLLIIIVIFIYGL